jgi:hypothetical protein
LASAGAQSCRRSRPVAKTYHYSSRRKEGGKEEGREEGEREEGRDEEGGREYRSRRRGGGRGRRREGRGEGGGIRIRGLYRGGSMLAKRWVIVEMLARVVNKLRGRAVEGGRVRAVGSGQGQDTVY